MSRPILIVNLIQPGGATTDLAPYLTQETAAEITSSIELPSKTNSFAAPEVGLKGYDDRAGTIRTILLAVTPTSTDYLLQFSIDGAQVFSGYVVPNTIQFDDKELSFAFTAVGLAARLATVSADDTSIATLLALQRSMAGWTVANSYYSGNAWLDITGAGACPVTANDRIRLVNAGKPEIATVELVGFDGTNYQLYVTGLKSNYAAGTPVELDTPFLHNVLLQTAVDALFTGAGLGTTGVRFLADNFTAASPFASPLLVPADLSTLSFALGGPRGGSMGAALALFTSTYTDRWLVQSTPPVGAWAAHMTATGGERVIDWSRYGTDKSYYLQGQRSKVKAIATPGGWNGQTLEYSWYCYDYTYNGAPWPPSYTRYHLRVAIDNLEGTFGVYNYTRDLNVETSADGYTWGGAANLDTVSSSTTTSELHYLVKELFGVDFDVWNGVVFFSDLDALGAAVTFYGSAWDVSAATLHANCAAERGAPHVYTQGYVGWFDLLQTQGNAPHVSIYTTTATGAALPFSNDCGLPWDFMPFSIVTNYGANAGGTILYALSSSQKDGTHLIRFTSKTFAWNTYSTQLLGPGSQNGAAEMLALGRTATAGAGTWPMVAIIGNTPWWVATTFSGVIPYLDLSEMTCGEAMGALATLVNGYYYVDSSGNSWFKTRSRSSGQTIANPAGVNYAALDDAGLISVTSSPRWENTFQFIRVENDKDATIYGEAGEAGFRGGPLDLTLQDRFIPSTSHAEGLAVSILAYLGRDLRAIEALHTDDGRRYELGYTFTCRVEGEIGATSFQIIGTTRYPLDGTIKILGLEM